MGHVLCAVHPRFRRPGTFRFQERELTYVRHPYNAAWHNERSAELAIAFDFLDRRPPGRLLEVGNVLSHYGRAGHTIVDRYERAPGVVNEDVVTFRGAEPFDTIVSVSTLEHVGWDEEPRQPDKVRLAFSHLHSLLAPTGELLFTVPVGYNPVLDALLWGDELGLTSATWLRRRRGNRWEEVTAQEARTSTYALARARAETIFVGRTGPP